KLFEVYVMDEDGGTQNTQELCALLADILPSFDVVIVADYGHGMLGPEAIRVLCEKSKCLAVNAQLNAGNHGFNTVSKYQRADFISLSEKEIRLETRNPSGDLQAIVEHVAADLHCPRVLVTRGAKGNLCYSRADG